MCSLISESFGDGKVGLEEVAQIITTTVVRFFIAAE